MLEDGAFSHKKDYVTIFLVILNLEGHPNRITGSSVKVIFLNRLILPIGGASAVKGLRSTGFPRLDSYYSKENNCDPCLLLCFIDSSFRSCIKL